MLLLLRARAVSESSAVRTVPSIVQSLIVIRVSWAGGVPKSESLWSPAENAPFECILSHVGPKSQACLKRVALLVSQMLQKGAGLPRTGRCVRVETLREDPLHPFRHAGVRLQGARLAAPRMRQ